jgi:hypothetical protein
MPSRKKKAGKARKAAKEAKAAEEEKEGDDEEQDALESQMQRLAIENLLINAGAVKKCHHGFEVESHGALCLEFVKTFQQGYITKTQQSGEKCLVTCFLAGTVATKDKFAAVWDDATKMTNIVSHRVAHSTECILDGKENPARVIASIAYYFEQYIATHLEKTQPVMKWHQIAELQHSDLHTLVKFLRKRIPCKCLDKKYKEVKSVTKMGVCFNNECPLPDRRAAQSEMFHCTGCRQVCYCSVECQKVDWPRHKEGCKQWAREKTEFDTKLKK